MLTALLLAAAPPHCADPAFCPTLAEIRSAIQRDDDEKTGTLIDDQNAVRHVTDIYCERPDNEEPRSVACKVVFHYRTGRNFVIVRLSKGEKHWVVEERLEVFQKR
ncbi:hypothetical protein [Sphingomonas soli]|uniref:hypothetical protein n=1 Tax=Sphingomonas soli TaxID=266127 RepID=UPI00082F2625|nr:hypothetical protein [Sphingomonas soli]